MNNTTPANIPVLQAQGLSRRFNEGKAIDLTVLQGVDLSVYAGETVAIVGASGSGKSTLLHMLGGLDVPTSGNVRLLGQDFAHMGMAQQGEMRNRHNGVLVSMNECTTVAYAMFNLQDRGRLFLGPGVRVYRGQIIGEHCRSSDLIVNPAKGKQLTNIRAAGSDENIILTPHVQMTLEQCIAYINEDEMVEVTPKSVRMRKRLLKS